MTNPFSDPLVNSAPAWPDLPALPGEPAPAGLPGQMPTPARRKGLSGEQWLLIGTALAELIGGKKTAGMASGAVQGVQQNIAGRMQRQQMAEQAAYRQQQAQMQQQQAEAQARNQKSLEQTRLAQERMRVYNLANETLARAETPEDYQKATRALYAESAAVPGLNIRLGTFEALHPYIEKRLEKWAKNTIDAGVKQFGGLNEWLAAKPVYETPEDYGPSQRLSAQDIMKFLKVSPAVDAAGQPMVAPADEPTSVKTARGEAGVLFEARFGRKPDPKNPKDTKALTRIMADQINPPKASEGPPEVSPGQVGITGEAVLKGIDPSKAALVRKMADYKLTLPPGFAWRTPYWQELLGLTMRFDPTFDQTQYQARQRLRQDATSGKLAGNIRSLNTAIAHLDTLKKKGEALSNWSAQPLNWAKNKMLMATGDPRVVEFENAANAVAAEAATAFKGTAGTDQEIKTWRTGLNNIQSPEQIRGGIDTITELISGRVSAIKDQFESGIGKPTDMRFLSPKSTNILTGLGVDVSKIEGGSVAAKPTESDAVPDGTRKPIPSIPGGVAEYRNGKWIRVK